MALYGSMMFFQGCTEHENIYKTDTITKVKDVSLEDGNSIFATLYTTSKHNGYNDLRIYFDEEELSGDEGLDTEKIKNEYFLQFIFKNELPLRYIMP